MNTDNLFLNQKYTLDYLECGDDAYGSLLFSPNYFGAWEKESFVRDKSSDAWLIGDSDNTITSMKTSCEEANCAARASSKVVKEEFSFSDFKKAALESHKVHLLPWVQKISIKTIGKSIQNKNSNSFTQSEWEKHSVKSDLKFEPSQVESASQLTSKRWGYSHDVIVFKSLAKTWEENGIPFDRFLSESQPSSEISGILNELLGKYLWKGSLQSYYERINNKLKNQKIPIRNRRLVIGMCKDQLKQHGAINYEMIAAEFPGKTVGTLRNIYERSRSS